jgi:hypothetical protein
MSDRSAHLLDIFQSAHLGPAHGLAKVLMHIADTYDDPESWEAVPRDALTGIAKELTADLPQPYGGR